MLSNTCKYGIRAVLYLTINSEDCKKIGIKKIAEDLDLPSPFLGKILQSLVKKSLLKSTKGPNGGFFLGKDSYEISLYDIVEAIDGTDIFEECLIGVKICTNNPEHAKVCPFNKGSHKVRRELKELFQNQTILLPAPFLLY